MKSGSAFLPGELPEYLGRILTAAEVYVQRGFGAAEAYVRASGNYCGHSGVGAAAVGEFDLYAFILEVTERLGKIQGRVEDRMRHFVYSYKFICF